MHRLLSLALSLTTAAAVVVACSPFSLPQFPHSTQPAQQIWLEPALATADLLTAFSQPDDWARARAKVNVLTLYTGQVISSEKQDCSICGPNLWPAIQRSGLLGKLSGWNIDLSLNLAALSVATCPVGATTETVMGNARDAFLLALDNVSGEGAAIYELTLDSSIPGALVCGFTPAQAADAIVSLVSAIRSANPQILIGIRENYPLSSREDILSWGALLLARGFKPDFFHLRVEFGLYDASLLSLPVITNALTAVSDQAAAQSIPLGISYSSGRPVADGASYFSLGVARLGILQPILGRPAHVIIQGVSSTSTLQAELPPFLPDSGSESLTAFLLEADSRLSR